MRQDLAPGGAHHHSSRDGAFLAGGLEGPPLSPPPHFCVASRGTPWTSARSGASPGPDAERRVTTRSGDHISIARCRSVHEGRDSGAPKRKPATWPPPDGEVTGVPGPRRKG